MRVVVRQISGLGNQLFQYAAGVYYSKHFAASMRLAIDPPQKAHYHGIPRPFLLSHFSITAPYEVLTRQDRLLLAQRRLLRPVAEVYQRLQRVQVFREELAQRYKFAGDPVLRRGTETLYVVGFWQSQEMVGRVEPRRIDEHQAVHSRLGHGNIQIFHDE